MGAEAGGIDPIANRVVRIVREAMDDKEEYEDWLMFMVIKYGINSAISADDINKEPTHRVVAAVSAKHISSNQKILEVRSGFWGKSTHVEEFMMTEKAQRYLNIMNNSDRVVEPQSIKENE
jgi:hypothetical protein